MEFYKYHGAGNDFILLDGFKEEHVLREDEVRWLCNRRLGVGSDGLVLIKPSTAADFSMEFFNPDGSTGMMCGNGARCAVMLAASQGYVPDIMSFETADGMHRGVLHDDTIVSITIPSITEIRDFQGKYFLHSGTAHLVLRVDDLHEDYDVVARGRPLRYEAEFQPEGTNVNFIERINQDTFKIRTYEKGVENETLACGTGIVASAVAAHFEAGSEEGEFIYNMRARVNTLQVSFNCTGHKSYENIWLKGPAQEVFKGRLDMEAIRVV